MEVGANWCNPSTLIEKKSGWSKKQTEGFQHRNKKMMNKHLKDDQLNSQQYQDCYLKPVTIYISSFRLAKLFYKIENSTGG